MEDEEKVIELTEEMKIPEPVFHWESAMSTRLPVASTKAQLEKKFEKIKTQLEIAPEKKWGITDINKALSNGILGLEEPATNARNEALIRMNSRYQLLQSPEKQTQENLDKLIAFHRENTEDLLSLDNFRKSTSAGSISSGAATALPPGITTNTGRGGSSWRRSGAIVLRNLLAMLVLLLLVCTAWIAFIIILDTSLVMLSGRPLWSKPVIEEIQSLLFTEE